MNDPTEEKNERYCIGCNYVMHESQHDDPYTCEACQDHALEVEAEELSYLKMKSLNAVKKLKNEAHVIDFSDPKLIKKMNECIEAQQKCLERKNINYKALHKPFNI